MDRWSLSLAVGLIVAPGMALGAPGLHFQSQSREVTAWGSRAGQHYSFSETNSGLGPWSLHPSFPDTVVLSHESSISPMQVSDKTDLSLDAQEVGGLGGEPGGGEGGDQMHLTFTVDSPTRFHPTGKVTQLVKDTSLALAGAQGRISLTGFSVLEPTPELQDGTFPFDVSGVFQPGQVYHLDLAGGAYAGSSALGPFHTSASYSMEFNLAVVPEPSWVAGLMGLAGLLVRRGRGHGRGATREAGGGNRMRAGERSSNIGL